MVEHREVMIQVDMATISAQKEISMLQFRVQEPDPDFIKHRKSFQRNNFVKKKRKKIQKRRATKKEKKRQKRRATPQIPPCKTTR
jgi:hypothetical protein